MTADIEVEEGQEVKWKKNELERLRESGERSVKWFPVQKELGTGKGRDFETNVRVRGVLVGTSKLSWFGKE